jgi:hypothetical protein
MDLSADPHQARDAPDGVRELLAHAWFTVGYPPVGSAVLVALRTDGGAGVVARVDLPRRVEHARLVGGALATAARHDGADAAVLVVVPAPRARRPPVLVRPERALVRAAHAGLRRAGVAVTDVIVVVADRFRSVLCVDPACCPTGGLPLGDLRATATGAALVLQGRALAASEADLAADVQPRPWSPDTPVGEPLSPPAALERWRALLAGRSGGEPQPDPQPADVAWLVPALADLRFRDAALASLLPGTADVADELAAGTVRGAAPLGGAETVPPDRDVLEAGRALLSAVARGAPAGCRGEALAVLAWASWWQGSGARARLLAAMALEEQPAHRLALLVDEMLLRGVRPPWIRGVPSSPEVP